MQGQAQNFINRQLNLSYKQYLQMGEDLTEYALGDYVIEQIIGQGAFGRVYKGFNSKTAQTVAVKTINFEMLFATYRQPTLSKILQLAKTEDILMRMCANRNIVQCYQVFQNQSLKIIVMEYCEGGTLQEYIRLNGKIPEKEALKIFKQILNGIAGMHSRSIVHRDLKPENILIHQGVFKICDLGFSKKLKEQQMDAITVIGTRPYMAPEIINSKRYGLKVDIWSAAVILYQMIFKEHPFVQKQKQLLLLQIKGSEIYKQTRIKANGYLASEKMSAFIKRMLVIDNSKRIGWKELIIDPILNIKDQNATLPRSMVADGPINVPSQLQASQIINQTQQSYSTLLSRINLKKTDSTELIIKKVSKQSIKIKKEHLRIKNDSLQIHQNLIQCLKNELIYNEIILKIQQFKMLDLSERISIDLLYLLSQRCFVNMSPINSSMLAKRKDHIFIEQIYQIVQTLYHKMKKTYQRYTNMLTEQQNKILNRLKDFFFSPSKEQQQSNIYFNGIEKTDYKRQEHVRFTQIEYINKIKNGLKGPFKEFDKVRRYLMNYQLINQISLSTLKNTNFDAYVQNIIEK